MTTRSRVDDLTDQLAAGLGDPVDTELILELLTTSASMSIPGFESASVSIREGDGAIQTVTASDEVAVQIDRLQYELREGPAYDVIAGTGSTIVTFMDDDQRWPTFGPRAAELGVGSMMSFELTRHSGLRSALNLYSRQGGALQADAVNVAKLFAAHAGATLGLIDRVGDLETALRSRSAIGQAVGITMERFGLTHDTAFGFLVRLSQNSNVKLRDIADNVIDEQHERALTGENLATDS